MNRNISKVLCTVLLSALSWGAIQAQIQPTDTIKNESRGLKQYTFVPKGQWIIGGTVSYAEASENNYQILIIEGINGSGYSFTVSPMFCYMFGNNIGAGGRFSYERSLVKLNSAEIHLGDDTHFDLSNIYRLSHTYTGMAIMRNYISIGKNMRFGLFNETQLHIGGGESKIVNGSGDNIEGSFDRNFSIGINLAPGIAAFINNYMAIELNVGLLGFRYTSSSQSTNQVYTGKTNSTSASFQINLFSIGLGLAFYI